MKTMLGMAAVLAGSLGFAIAAHAAPLAPAHVFSLAGQAQLDRVDYVCGPGFHAFYGRCIRNGPRPYGFYSYARPYGWGGYGYYRPRPYYRPYGFYGPRPFF